VGAGTGLLYLLRWYWWRINAWSEIAAMVSSFIVAAGFFVAGITGHGVPTHIALLATVGVTTVAWVVTALATEPTDRATLVRFYRLVQPAGRGWDRVRGEAGVGPSPDRVADAMLGWVFGCTAVYAALFGAGSLLYGRWAQGVVWVTLFVASCVGLRWLLPRLWSSVEAGAVD
jgi:hypothetical protein